MIKYVFVVAILILALYILRRGQRREGFASAATGLTGEVLLARADAMIQDARRFQDNVRASSSILAQQKAEMPNLEKLIKEKLDSKL